MNVLCVSLQQLPCLMDGIDVQNLSQEQHSAYPELFREADQSDDSTFILVNGILHSTTKPSPQSPCYPRLVLPPKYHENVINRAHKEVGHMAFLKTLERIREAYYWPGMCKQIKTSLSKRTICIAHSKQKDKSPMGEKPLPVSPLQMVSLDLLGPFVPSKTGNKYILTIICHATAWAEAFPLPDKTNESVWKVLANQFFPVRGAPEVVLSDNGREFTANAFTQYLKQLGIDHRRTTPARPQCNNKVERFNRTLKEILTKAINNQPTNWEDHIGDTLWAYRISINAATGYSPYYLLFGRQPRAPLTRLLKASTSICPFGNRLDDPSQAFAQAHVNTREGRIANRERLAKQANAKEIKVGDMVVLRVPEPVTFSSRWDPQWQVTRASTSICPFGNRLDDPSQAFAQAHVNTREGRIANRERLAKQANAKEIKVGDMVVLRVPEPVTFSSRWDPQWQVTRVSGLTLHIRNQVTGIKKVIHRDHIKLVDPFLPWDQLPPRPKRARRRQVWDAPVPTANQNPKTPPTDLNISPECPNNNLCEPLVTEKTHVSDFNATDQISDSQSDNITEDQSQDRLTPVSTPTLRTPKQDRTRSPHSEIYSPPHQTRLRARKRIKYDLDPTAFVDDILDSDSD